MLSSVNPDYLRVGQKRKALRAVNLIKLKRSRKLKIRMCDNGAPSCQFVPRKEVKSPTITIEGLLVTMMIDAYADIKVEIFDPPGAYLQTDLPKVKFTLLLLEGKIVDIMCDINTEYKHQVRFKHGRKILYICILKAIYGIIESDLIWYELYMSVLKNMGFQLNPYDMCVANKDIKWKQCTTAWNVDDNKVSYL